MTAKKKPAPPAEVTAANLREVMNYLGDDATYDLLQQQFKRTMEPETAKRVEAAKSAIRDEYRRYYALGDKLVVLAWAVFGAGFVAAIAFAIYLGVHKDLMEHKAQLEACQRGDKQNCLAAVHDQMRSTPDWSRIALLRQSYFTATGQQLPMVYPGGTE